MFLGNVIIPVPTGNDALRAFTFSVFLKNKIIDFDSQNVIRENQWYNQPYF